MQCHDSWIIFCTSRKKTKNEKKVIFVQILPRYSMFKNKVTLNYLTILEEKKLDSRLTMHISKTIWTRNYEIIIEGLDMAKMYGTRTFHTN